MTITLKQRADLTYKANIEAGRHGWLRLTPAYGINLVYSELAKLPKGSHIIEPFSGSGTTPLAASELGMRCQAREINPFLVWFGNAKLAEYSADDVAEALDTGQSVIDKVTSTRPTSDLWVPPMFNISRWWDRSALAALATIKAELNQYTGKTRDLLDVAFCRLLISLSSAAFNHQSMSFKDHEPSSEYDHDSFVSHVQRYSESVHDVSRRALASPVRGEAEVRQGNSTQPFDAFEPADLVITSPPYANRMSYIRELRPYMYWMKYLETGEQAGELDWRSIGGTWGSASTKVKEHRPDHSLPIDAALCSVCEKILEGKSGSVLSPYVRKYFDDMWLHFNAITPVIRDGGRICYIVGNSTFSGIEVPTHAWYVEMLKALGYADVQATAIRKRNSNKRLYEYAVTAVKC